MLKKISFFSAFKRNLRENDLQIYRFARLSCIKNIQKFFANSYEIFRAERI